MKNIRQMCRKHPNSIMLISYLFMMTSESFAGNVSQKIPYLFILIIPGFTSFLNLWIRNSREKLWKTIKSINWLRRSLLILVVFFVGSLHTRTSDLIIGIRYVIQHFINKLVNIKASSSMESLLDT